MHEPKQDTNEIIIVGGGIVGLLIARELLQRGHAIQVLDAGDGHETASCGNAGIIAPGHPPISNPRLPAQALALLLDPNSPLYIPPRPDPSLIRWLLGFRRSCDRHRHARTVELLNGLSRLSLDGWNTLVQDNHLAPPLRADGWAEVCCEPASMDAAAADADVLARDGFTAELIDGDELRRRDDSFTDAVVGALIHPNDILTDPAALMQALVHDIRHRGGRVRHRCMVDSLLLDGRGHCHGVLLEPDEALEADAVVLAAGIWSDGFAKRHGVRVPMQAAKGYHLMLETKTTPRTGFVCRETMVAVNPMPGGVRLAGTLELSGINQRMSRRRLELLRRGTTRYLHGIPEARVTKTWNGLRPCTADGLPVIGPLPNASNAFVATGHGMMGVTLGPATARSIGELIDGETTTMDLAPFAADRF